MAFVNVSTSATLKGRFRKEIAWKIISDYSRYPTIMENVDEVKIHERNENRGVSEWFVTVEEAPLRWVETDYYDKEKYELRFESIEGDFDNINGHWKIENYNNEGIKIQFNIDYNLGIPVIEEVLGHILKEKMKTNIDSMINAVQEELKKEQGEDRKYERFPIGKKHNLHINDNRVRASIINISQGGMMIDYDGKLDPLNAVVKINGNIIDSEIILHDLKRKNYRIVFKDILSLKDTKNIVAILSQDTLQVQEAVMIDNEYVTTSEQDAKDKDLVNIQ